MGSSNMLLFYTLALLFAIAECHQYPRYNKGRKSNPCESGNYVQTKSPRGCYKPCPEGKVYSERDQCCVWAKKCATDRCAPAADYPEYQAKPSKKTGYLKGKKANKKLKSSHKKSSYSEYSDDDDSSDYHW